MSDSAPAAPPPPDYTGAANATAAGNIQAAQQGQQANLIDQFTPYGSLTYTEDPTSRFSSGNPSYSSNIDLNSTGQQLLDESNQSQLGLGALQNGALSTVQNTMSNPMDLSSVNDVENQSMKNQMQLLQPQIDHTTAMADTQLKNQGLQPGTEAYDNAMRSVTNGNNNLLATASNNAIATAPQTYQLASAEYNQPLNELNALRTGSQVTNPTFGSTPQQQTAAGANQLQAATATGQYGQGIYNAQVGATNANNAATGSAVGAIGAAALAFF